MKNFSWDEYFMTMAYLVSMKSKDPSTRVGAVIVGTNNEVKSTGYNGFPRGVIDSQERYDNREFKLLAINHAEENAILHCARNGASTEGSSIYSQWIPCSLCAKSIIQAGIKEVVYDPNFPGNKELSQKDWKDSITITRQLFSEAKVVVREFSGKLIKIEGLYKTNKIDLL